MTNLESSFIRRAMYRTKRLLEMAIEGSGDASATSGYCDGPDRDDSCLLDNDVVAFPKPIQADTEDPDLIVQGRDLYCYEFSNLVKPCSEGPNMAKHLRISVRASDRTALVFFYE